jgi:signal transduction histidine kinase
MVGRKPDIQLQMETDEVRFEFPVEIGSPLIRIIQEALINVRKHAKINQVVIRLGQEGDRLFIRVEDQG